MSDTTRNAVEDALRVHIADEDGDGAVVTHWVLVAGVYPKDDEVTSFWIQSPIGQPNYVSAGLLWSALHTEGGAVKAEDE